MLFDCSILKEEASCDTVDLLRAPQKRLKIDIGHPV
jgi:hypothetical protein